MKHSNMKIFLRIFSLAFILAVAFVPARTQVQLYANLSAANGIVRYVAEDCILIYSQTYPDHGSFILHSANGGHVFDLPARMLVNDFEIDGEGNAWFCGDMSGTPVVGMFSIADAFLHTGFLFYTFCTAPTTYPIIPCSLTRMEVVKQGPFTYVAAVGEGKPNVATPTGNVAIVMSVWMDLSSGLWSYDLSYDKGENVFYTDITVLDNHIVAVGTDRQGYHCYVKTYRKMINFPVLSRYSDTLFVLRYSDAHEGPVLVTKIKDDDASIVQYGSKRYSVANTVVNFSASGDIAGAKTIEAINPHPFPEKYSMAEMTLRETRYSQSEEKTLVLHRGYHSLDTLIPSTFSVDSWLLHFPTEPPVTDHTIWLLQLGKEYSLDTAYVGNPVTCGLEDAFGYLHAYNRILFGSGCETPFEAPFRYPDYMEEIIHSTEHAYSQRNLPFLKAPISVYAVDILDDCQ